MRAAYETFLAQFAVPESVDVRPVNAGGVSSLALSPKGVDDIAILYLHGGGFIVGSAYGYRPLVGALVAAAGVGALVPDFRLAPEHPFPAAVEDALSAYRWLVDQWDPAQIVLAGDSAGAGLACSLLLTLRAQDLPLPAGAAFLCPGVDPTGDTMLASAPAGRPPEELTNIQRSAAAYLAGHPADDPIVNPLHADLTGLPPLLAQTATGDVVLAESRLLVERARAHGVDAQLEVYTADTHVFHVFWPFLPEAADALTQAGSFIRARLADQRAEPRRARPGCARAGCRRSARARAAAAAADPWPRT
jgi:acetyl esterase/lipase